MGATALSVFSEGTLAFCTSLLEIVPRRFDSLTRLCAIFEGALLSLSIISPPQISAQPVPGSYIIYQGFQMKLRMTDYGEIGNRPYDWLEEGIGCEYPVNSQIEHLAGC